MSYTFQMYNVPKTEETAKDAIPIDLSKIIDDRDGRALYDNFGVTYNYTKIIDPLFDDALMIIYKTETDDIWAKYFHNKSGSRMEPILRIMINKIGEEEPDEDYFKCTKGNCLVALKTLLKMCETFPNGIFWIY